MQSSKVLELKKGEATDIVAEIARLLQLPLDEDCQKGYLKLRSPIGDGQIMCYQTNKGLSSIIFDCTLDTPLSLVLQGNFAQPIMLYTVAKGHLAISSGASDFKVDNLQGTIHGAYGTEAYQLRLPPNEPILIMMTFLQRKVFFKEIDCGVLELPPELLRVVQGDPHEEQEFLFQDLYHLPALDTIHSIVDHDQTGLLHSAHASAMIYENMFLQLNEYKRLLRANTARLVKDSTKITQIKGAEKILLSNLQDPPTIPLLAKMVGINQQTLKTGFRQLYGKTINKYLNEYRLQQAGLLITTGDLSIAEVANVVGYSNGGYFSRKFKQKYGITPSKFRAEGTGKAQDFLS